LALLLNHVSAPSLPLALETPVPPAPTVTYTVAPGVRDIFVFFAYAPPPPPHARLLLLPPPAPPPPIASIVLFDEFQSLGTTHV
jgi:hypothetical protein